MQIPPPAQLPPEFSEPHQGFLSSKRKLIIAIAILVIALGYFGYTAFQGATVFYLTVGELQGGKATPGEIIRVNGKLVPNSFQRDSEGTIAKFTLTDGLLELPAVHDGVVPDLFFNEHSEIVLQGLYDQNGIFQSQLVVVKCPSKYESLESKQLDETIQPL
jgi:cytochrome c-type biogenesis protein CcmE